MEKRGDKKKLTKESLQPIQQVQDLGKEEQSMCSETLREDTASDGLRLRLEILSRQKWRMWLSWRTYAEKGIWLDPEMEKAEMVEELVQYMEFCGAVKRNKEATVPGKLVVINVYREQWVGLSLPVKHVRVRAVRQGTTLAL